MNKVLLLVVVMSFLLFSIGCGKQEERKQSNVEKPTILTQNDSAKTNTKIETKELTTDKIDGKRVGSLVSRFSDMLGNLVKFAGGDTYMRTNKIDLEEFVKGKTERDIYTFVRKSPYKSPYASKQVCEYLLENTTNKVLYVMVSHVYSDLLLLVGNENDRERALSVCENVKNVYVHSLLPDQYQTPRRREKLIIIMNSYGVVLGDTHLRKEIVNTIRCHGNTAEEQAAADFYDAMLKIENGASGDLEKARALLHGIQNRGTYSYYDATEEDVKEWLENFDVWATKVKSRVGTAPKSFLGMARNLKNVKYER